MSEGLLQPVPGQGAVSPVVQASDAGQSGTPAQSAQEQASQQGTAEARTVTTQDLAALREELKREIQSQADKRDTKVRERLSEFDKSITQLKAAGKEFPEEEVKDLRAKVATSAREELDNETTAPAPVPDWTDVSQWDQSDPIVQAVKDAQKEIGIALTADMPEAKSVVRNQGPRAFLKSYEAALTAAKTRLSAPASEDPKSKSTPAARIPSTGTSSTGTASSASDYWKDAYKK